MNMHNPAHAGQLVQEWLDGLKEEGTAITLTQLSKNMGVTRTALSRMLHGHTALTADMALRLQAALGMSAELLMRVQATYEIWQASQQPRPHIELLVASHVLVAS
jgi:antitoxin HigA-1